MEIKTPKDLEKLFKLCRENGIETFKHQGIEFTVNSAYFTSKSVKKQRTATAAPVYAPGGVTEETQIESIGGLTPEQLLFGSSDPSVWASDQ